MSASRKELIHTLAKTGKKSLAKHRASSQSFLAGGLESGLVGRTFNAFPSLVTDKQVADLEAIVASIVKLKATPEGPYHLIDPFDKKAIRRWYWNVAKDACIQMLDGYGQIKWALIDLLGWENYESCYVAKGINQLIYSYVHTVFQQASQRAVATVNSKIFEFSALGVYFNSISDELSVKVKAKTQIEDHRTRDAILRGLVHDYKLTLNRIDETSSFLSKLFSGDRDKERKIESKIIVRCFSDKTTELGHLFLQMRLECEGQGILSNGSLSRVLKHYSNKLYSFKLDSRVSTLKVTHRLEDSMARSDSKTETANKAESAIKTSEMKKEQSIELKTAEPVTTPAGQETYRNPRPLLAGPVLKVMETQQETSDEVESSYVVIKSEEAKESESYKLSRLAWWMSFFINPTLENRAPTHLAKVVQMNDVLRMGPV